MKAKVCGRAIFIADELMLVLIDVTLLLFWELGPGLGNNGQGVLVFLRKFKYKLSQKFHVP